MRIHDVSPGFGEILITVFYHNFLLIWPIENLAIRHTSYAYSTYDTERNSKWVIKLLIYLSTVVMFEK